MRALLLSLVLTLGLGACVFSDIPDTQVGDEYSVCETTLAPVNFCETYYAWSPGWYGGYYGYHYVIRPGYRRPVHGPGVYHYDGHRGHQAPAYHGGHRR